MNVALPTINAAIARLSFMTNGKIGRDWHSGRPFVIHEKGREWDALKQALAALRDARREIEQRS